jgi:hypothetical protein
VTYAKAVTGALVAGLGALGTAWADGRMTPVEWVGVATATLVAAGAVWSVPNRVPPEPGEHAESDERLHEGHVRKIGGYTGTTPAADVPPPARHRRDRGHLLDTPIRPEDLPATDGPAPGEHRL